MSGWGLSPWGIGPWGLPTTFSPSGSAGRVFAIGDRTVRVTLTFEPQHRFPSGVGDALNPKTWQITGLTTGRVLTPIAVSMVDAFTYDLLTLELLDSAQRTMTLATSTLKTVTGVTVTSLYFTYAGCLLDSNTSYQAQTAAAGLSLRDLANPPTPNSPVGGAMEITSAGDYKTVNGDALLKKLIMRRLVSKRGDFFHLPNYGAGLRAKDVLPSTSLRKLAKSIEEQVKLEAGVLDVSASLSYAAASGALTVQLKVLTNSGQVSVSLAVPSGSMQF